ncbi:unnamed protein product [Auanema sp. JU1783]|nr:unnamed protein product [Auanema sp. JU1783]
MSLSFDFSNKKILVTGASQGIGRELVVELTKRGATVFALGRNEKALEELSRLCGAVPIVCDVTDSEDAIRRCLEPYQPFGYLVNNAGIAILEPFGEISPESFTRTLDVNVKGPLLISQVVSNEMIKHKIQGVIVNVSSQASVKPLDSHTSYCASKAALDMLTMCMARELGPKGIRVNSVNPTVVMTEMGRKNWSDMSKAKTLLDRMPVQRFAEVEDVVNSIMFLLSSGSSMTTGSILPVDGGYINQ